MTTKAKIVMAIGVVATFSFLFVIGLGEKGAADLYQLHLKKVNLQTANIEMEKKNRALYRSIQRLRHDPEYVEGIARRELGMVAEDEVVYQFSKERGPGPGGKR